MASNTHIQTAVQALQHGKVIAYPTESMYGIGCDPFCQTALERIINIKQRSSAKGLILVASHWEQVQHLTTPLPAKQYDMIFASWPGHTTWLFPASEQAPPLVIGAHSTIAIRISAHPIVHKLCSTNGGPIVSTSANRHQETPCLTADQVSTTFANAIDYIVPGKLGHTTSPSRIIHAQTGKTIR